MELTTDAPAKTAPSHAEDSIRPEQLRYARLLDVLSKLGFAALVAGFLAYAFGLLDAHVTVEQLPSLWTMPLAEYLKATQTPTGWAWLAHLHKGEYAGLLGIAMLSGCSAVCLAGIVPIYFRRGDRAYAALCVLEIVVLLLAASGVFGVGH
jgi:hypothetical protein